ncbi:MAG: universal stress protein [Myxococcales bacterium]|nr:universal stress protein [Myxococcales bacterium]
MIESILVGTDGSATAASAESFAVALAARMRAQLAGLAVVEERSYRATDDGLGLPPRPVEGLEGWLKARADAACRRLSDRARAAGIEVVCETAHGIADDRIVERAAQASLLVLGRDGENAEYRSALIGSVVDAAIRKTHKPAVVVPAGAELSGPLVLAFDGSPGSRIAAKLTVELANRLSEPVHVFVDSKDKGRAAARFDEVRRLLGGLSVPVRETASTLGRPDVKIIDAAREAGAGLIVMGAFGRSRITEYFLGSNSAAVIRNSPIAVLLAR